LGLLNFAYTSNDLVIGNPTFLKMSLKKLRKIQKTHSRAKRGSQNKQDMSLNKRIFNCSSCDISIDRDLNATKNIVAAGMSVLKLVDGDDIGLPDEARISGLQAG